MDFLKVFLVILTAKTSRGLFGKLPNGTNIETLTTCREIKSLDIIVWETSKAESQEPDARFVLKFHPSLFAGQFCSHNYYFSYCRMMRYRTRTVLTSCGNFTLQENGDGTDIVVFKNVFDSEHDSLDRQYETMIFTMVNAENGEEVRESCHVMSKSDFDNSFKFDGIGVPYVTMGINETTATTIKLNIELPNCEDRPYFISFYQTIYQIVDSKDSQNVSIFIEGQKTEYLLRNLIPFKNYSITVAAITTENMRGNFGNEKIIGTLESCPQIPPVIHGDNITNQSFELKLETPKFSNGKLIYMRVNLSEPNVKILDRTLTGNGTHLLDGLTPYTNYSFTLSLCTKICCSPESMSLSIRTDIGVSGAPVNFCAYELHDTIHLGKLQWKIPRIGGPNYIWEIWVNFNNESEPVEVGEIYESEGIAIAYVPYLKCEGRSNTRYEFRVRALVYGKDGQIFVGQFSNSDTITGCKNYNYEVYYIVGVIFGFLTAIVAQPLFKRLYIARSKHISSTSILHYYPNLFQKK